ncbi:uncharacterized protein LOC112084116 [Eutrema salsugineum]|uniref:uncharacterized protein LOC112084116 n=1 Tax=Eutrema salsugineum TaxID=72664 RepID=UPI000CED1DBD|nr:uncharacterized protein LOC112084116 [Eutrema salsugineum]
MTSITNRVVASCLNPLNSESINRRCAIADMLRSTFYKRAREDLALCHRLLHIPYNEPEPDSKPQAEHMIRNEVSKFRDQLSFAKLACNSGQNRRLHYLLLCRQSLTRDDANH